MKNKLLIATVLLTSIVFAANGNCRFATVRVEFFGLGDCEVVLDGQSAGVRFGNVYFDQVRPGYHELSVLMISRNSHHGYHGGSRRNSCRPTPVVLAATTFRIKPGSNLVASIDRFGRVFLADDLSYSMDNGFGHGCASSATYPLVNSPLDAEFIGVMPVNPFNAALSDRELSDIIAAASSRPFSSTRMDILSTAIQGRLLSVHQVHRLLDLFTFESDRLVFAKVAFSNTMDRERYYMLYDAFTFDSSIEELERYMRSCA